ncbi:MAG: DUF3667 domain-containing protein [Deltaproteobacteria bacterium]|nr:DUF3667 domain-containing protein [Deltaproteobacteria bacterium]
MSEPISTRPPATPAAAAPAPAGQPLATAPASVCRNCDAPLFGPYCARCGQQVRGSARALSTLLFDARDALIHLDSRLWRTLHALSLRPGRLTAEYFAERRASYLPPFRLYLVLSLAFFTLAAFDRLRFGDGEMPLEVSEEARKEAQREVARAAEEARASGAPAEKLAVLDQVARRLEKSGETPGADRKLDVPPEKACEGIEVTGSPRIQAALIEACKRNVGDRGRTLYRTVVANIPRMMFVFLPLMALFLKAVYWRPRRYYVEHLVFFLHAHAALFLVAIAAMAVRTLARWTGLGWLGGLAAFAGWAYATWYVWRALRIYYGQGKLLTALKFFALGVAYLTFLSLTLLGTVVVSAAMAS